MPTVPRPTAAAAARRVAVLLALALALAALLGWAFDQGRPVALPEVGERRLPCVSYAPFRRPGATPFDAALRIEPAAIEADLRALRAVTGCVRTYGVDHGLDAVPAIARTLGLRVVLGAWIGRDAEANAAQLERALALAREHADVIDLLMVGNEVLLRRELAPEALAALLAQARRVSPVPVSSADVWEFWLRHAAVLRGHVDVVSVHVLPYWEDEPVAAGQAVAHVRAVAARVGAAVAPLPVFVAETGWPAAGRQRGPAVPGPLQQARFVRELLASAGRAGDPALRFNLIEGFDQPWKRALEGAMGGYWGVFDADARQRVTLTGAVTPDPQAHLVPLSAGVGGALGGGGALAWVMASRRASRRRGVAPLHRRAWPLWNGLLSGGIAGALIGGLAPLQWQMLAVWSRSPVEWAWGGAMALVAMACAVAAAVPLTARLIAPARATEAPRPGVVDALRVGGRTGLHVRLDVRLGVRGLACAHAALLFVVALTALGLVFDPRYRPLVWPMFAAPALLLLGLTVLGERLHRGAREERLLAAVCAAAAPWVAVQEGWANTQALGTAATWLALAVATWWPHRAAPVRPAGRADSTPVRPAGRTHTNAPSSTAGAARSVE